MNQVNFYKRVGLGSTVYSCNVFKELSSDVLVHIPDDCRQDFLY